MVDEIEQEVLSFNDLKTIIMIVDAGSQRGAWKGDELNTIGLLRTKISAILIAADPSLAGKQVTQMVAATSTDSTSEVATPTTQN